MACLLNFSYDAIELTDLQPGAACRTVGNWAAGDWRASGSRMSTLGGKHIVFGHHARRRVAFGCVVYIYIYMCVYIYIYTHTHICAVYLYSIYELKCF